MWPDYPDGASGRTDLPRLYFPSYKVSRLQFDELSVEPMVGFQA
jgi:hypothetical protein